MNRICSAFTFIAASLFAVVADATAASIDPLPGSLVQETQVFCFFRIPVGVIVTDDFGAPLAGAPVTFTLPDPGLFAPDSGGNVFTIISDANGLAVPDPRIMASNLPGTYIAYVDAPQGALQFQLTVVPGGPASISTYSGSRQTAPVGTTYPQPWVAQVLDANGNGVPWAAVQFFANPTGPSGTFMGTNSVFVQADDNGLASAPLFTANLINGHAMGIALAESNTPDPTTISTFFTYTNTSAKK
jgi:hypothetical protein